MEKTPSPATNISGSNPTIFPSSSVSTPATVPASKLSPNFAKGINPAFSASSKTVFSVSSTVCYSISFSAFSSS